MDWNISYNWLYHLLQKSAGSGVKSFYSEIDDWTDDLITISVIILCSESLDPKSSSSNGQAQEFLAFCGERRENQSGAFFSFLRYFISALSSDANDSQITKVLNQIEEIKLQHEIFNSLEFQIIIYLLKCKLNTNNFNKIKSDQLVAQLHAKIDGHLKADHSMTPYISFLQQLKYSVYSVQLIRFQTLSKWSAYLTSSYQLINEGLLDLSSENSLLLQWYSQNSDFSSILPLFTKALLLEPYGYFKSSICYRLRLYFTDINKSQILDSNCPISKILTHLAYGKFFTLSASSDTEQIFSHIQDQFCTKDEEFHTIFNNLIDWNIIIASKKFSTVKLSTLYTLFSLQNSDTSGFNLIDAVSKLSREKKLVVRINQCDDILTFPLHRKGESESLNAIFAHILPQALERDWDRLMISNS